MIGWIPAHCTDFYPNCYHNAHPSIPAPRRQARRPILEYRFPVLKEIFLCMAFSSRSASPTTSRARTSSARTQRAAPVPAQATDSGTGAQKPDPAVHQAARRGRGALPYLDSKSLLYDPTGLIRSGWRPFPSSTTPRPAGDSAGSRRSPPAGRGMDRTCAGERNFRLFPQQGNAGRPAVPGASRAVRVCGRKRVPAQRARQPKARCLI